MEGQHLSLSEVAGLMGVSERTVRRWIKSGKLRAYKPGRDYRIPESAVRELVEKGEVSPKGLAPSPEPSLFNGLEDERRTPPLQSWTALVSRVADRWEKEIAECEREWQGAKPTVRGHVKRVPNLNWAVEISNTANDIVDAASEQLELALGVATSSEALELFRALKRLDKVVGQTASWFGSDAPADLEAHRRKRAEKLRNQERRSRASSA
jgi:excisionase family DNA binding protein